MAPHVGPADFHPTRAMRAQRWSLNGHKGLDRTARRSVAQSLIFGWRMYKHLVPLVTPIGGGSDCGSSGQIRIIPTMNDMPS